ncbi:cytochrome c oxidase subunit II [Acuticoccus yangtzensis]|uniref:cytochrome c oxidase subunit II n=1 Tax=Acuticoccus yangtzensis TaxID=1443441 RepID=UPI001FE97E6B|nr:cytochrome c oxidase subunit II [Acuticoccus yangtzensis]
MRAMAKFGRTAFGRLGAAAATMMLAASVLSTGASAAQPEPWKVTLQDAATPIMEQIRWFEGYTLIIIALITLFVLGLLIWVVVRYNAKANPVPSKTSHNTMIEVVWTIVPVLILVAIAFPSFRLLYNETTIPEPDLTVKATGKSWFWEYEYMDEAYADVPPIISNMLQEDDRAERKSTYNMTDAEAPRLLAVDYPLVVPVGKIVHVLTTSSDVNHALAMPAFGIKADAINGRLNETWFRAEATGVYYGQCSELCGQSHAFMPLEIHVLDEAQFEEWVAMSIDDPDAAQDQLLKWQAEAAGIGQNVAALSAN